MRLPIRSFVVLGALSFGALGACTPARSGASHASAALVDAPRPAASPKPSQQYPRPSGVELASRLTPLQFEVTQHAGTEPPFQNAYWDNHEPGIYVDVATGEPLFSSRDKFESGTGWPSFTRPIEDGHVVTASDATLGMVRTEALSASGGSHLGHVFDDGPAPTHQRYCINSASLRFIPASHLAAAGYGSYATAFGAGAVAEVAPATSNSCTLPPPGKAPGCSATLDVAIFASALGDARVAQPAGVLDVVRGHEGPRAAVEVTFDPSKLAYADLLTAWTKGRAKGMVVFTRTDEQRQTVRTSSAVAQGVTVQDAVPFQRD